MWRTSALSPQQSKHLGQTRMRARSIGKGTPAAAGAIPQPHLSPTIPGSPVPPPGMGSGSGSCGPSPLTRHRAELDRPRPHPHPRGFSSTSGTGRDLYDPEEQGTVSAEWTEESGSTRSDSPPPRTPRDVYALPSGSGSGRDGPHVWVESPSRRNSDVDHHEREAWRTGGEPLDDDDALAKKEHDAASAAAAASSRRNRSQSLEGVTRMSLRRGRSFTSLVSPSPGTERKDPFGGGVGGGAAAGGGVAARPAPPPPIFEQYEPPPTPLVGGSTHDTAGSGSGMEEAARPATLYPPATGGVPVGGVDALGTSSTTMPKTLRDFVPQLVILVSLFVSSFAVIAFTISTLPGLFLPHSVADLPALTATLSTYRASSPLAELHLFAVLTLLFLWKQCFSIPGSVLTNILFGALYGTTLGTWWACLWTATGSTGAYAIALVIAPLVRPLCPPLASSRATDLASQWSPPRRSSTTLPSPST